MYRFFDSRLKSEVINLAPGEFFATDENLLINTVLGSCVSVVLYDPVRRAGGLNHFMLAEAKSVNPHQDYFKVERYGLYAMESLINSFLKMGCRKVHLQAKIFGGSRVLETGDTINIGNENILFAEEFLKTEGIPVVGQDTGGKSARKIYLYADSFKVLLKRVNVRATELEHQMQDYIYELEHRQDENTPVLF